MSTAHKVLNQPNLKEHMEMAKQENDNVTQDMWTTEEKQLMVDAIKTHGEKIARKAAADAPKSIKELWQQEMKKLEELARKVVK